MQSTAVIFEAPESLAVRQLVLHDPGPDDVVVEVDWSGISTGTEKLLYTGAMPPFPGMGYPLVPGYESVGRVVGAGRNAEDRLGEWVFVPGSNGFDGARGLFGGSARRVVLPAARTIAIAESLGRDGVLMALAATALHTLAGGDPPDLIIGHGILGRLLARLTIASGAPAPVVHEINDSRSGGATGYTVLHPDADDRRDYRAIYDVSGDAAGLDRLIGRLAKGGEVVLAGFYHQPLSFAFAPAFLREARLRVAAEWGPDDLAATRALIETGALSLAGLISHSSAANDARDAYPEAFFNPDCLKMILDWRAC